MDVDAVLVGDVREARRQEGGCATADHAKEAQGKQGEVSAPRRPVERVVGRVFRLGFQDDLSIRSHLLRRLLHILGDLTVNARRDGRVRRSRRRIAQPEGLVVVGGQQQDGACRPIGQVSWLDRQTEATGQPDCLGRTTYLEPR